MFLGDNMLVLSHACSHIGTCDNKPYSDMEVVRLIAQNTLLLSIAQFFLSSDMEVVPYSVEDLKESEPLMVHPLAVIKESGLSELMSSD
jgi:hypothetical protein